MDSRRDRMRMYDRLSGLPDDVILKILSFVGVKEAIGTSVLSPKWRFMWTLAPDLYFSTSGFPTMDKFYDFFTNVLSHRNNQVRLSSFKFLLHGRDIRYVAQTIVNHAFTLNVPQVIACICENSRSSLLHEISHITEFTLSLSSSQTLKHLILRGYITLTSAGTREFSSLTTLNLQNITLYEGFFSKCPNLVNLTLSGCKVAGYESLRVCHPRLSNLTLKGGFLSVCAFIVVTPQLTNLAIWEYRAIYHILAPKLVSLLIRGRCPSIFSTDGFPSLEKAQLSLHSLSSLDATTIINLLQEFHNVKFLSLSMDTIERLNSSVELIEHEPSPLANLKSLKILPKIMSMREHQHMKVNMSTEVKNYLLNGSPEATLN